VNVHDAFEALVNQGATPITAAGFKRTHLTFHRRRGLPVQVVDFQPASGMGQDWVFYVNIGIAFDDLYQVTGKAKSETPLEEDCHFRSRLEALVPACPMCWVICSSDSSTGFFQEVSKTNGREIAVRDADIPRVAEYLAKCIEPVIDGLNKIDGPKAFLHHAWASMPSSRGLVRYLSRFAEDDRGALV
jgi:uncharacterized protein DUF4304